MNIQESFVKKTLNKKTSDIVPTKLELDVQSFISLLSEYTDSLGITNFSKGDIVDTKSESGRELPFIVQKEVKRIVNLDVKSFVVSLVVSPYSYFWGRASEIPVFDLKFKVLFYPNENNVRIGIYVNDFKADCCRKKGVSYEVIPRHFFRKSDGCFLEKGFDFFYKPKKFLELTKMGIDTDTLGICKNYIKHIADFKIETEKGTDVLKLSNESLEDVVTKVQSIFGDELFCLEEKVLESFTKKVSRKNSSDLISDIDYPDGVYILHQTLGVKDVEGWNSKNNKGVVGILLIEDEHKIVVALEDAPGKLTWSKKYGLINQSVDFDELEDAESDFNGEYYCRKLDSPDFPAAYYCKTYNKGGRNWYLPSSGELRLICNHFKEIQNALSIVGGQKLVAIWGKDVPEYLSSTESSPGTVWALDFSDDYLDGYDKVSDSGKVRPFSNFSQNRNLKESFTKKIKSTRKSDLNSKPSFVLDNGVYILHETLGVITVDGWNPKNNKGVVGILLIEDDHKIVVALKDSPKNLRWSKKRKLVNQPFDESEESDFNGEYYCQKLDSPGFPAAYYCKTYNKGGRNWYLPSSGELWLIYQHLEEIQNALSIVGGQRFVTVRGEGTTVYWSSTEDSAMHAWAMGIGNYGWCNKIGDRYKVRPVSNFNLSELKESFTKKIRKSNSKEIVQDADTNAFNPLMDAKEFVNRLEECILSYKQPYVYGKKNPYNLEKFSFEMITSWPNTFKFNGHKFNYGSSELLFDVSNSKKPSFRIKLNFYNQKNNIICYLTVGPIKPNYRERIYEDRLFQYINDSKRISFVENLDGVRFDDNMESIEPTLRNLNFILNDIRFLMDNWKILYKTYLKKNSFETWNEFYKMLPSQNNKGFDFDLKESFAHKISKKTSGSLKGREMFGEMESFGEFDMLFKRFLKKHENQFSSCFMTNYPFKSKMLGRIGYKVVLKKDCPFEDGSDDRTVLRFSLDVFQRNIMNFPEDQDLNTPHGILTAAFYTELGPSTPQQIDLANLEFIGGNESPVDFRFVKFKERREWEKPNFSYQLLFGLERFLLALVETMNNMDEQTWSEIGRTSANFNPFKGEACCGADSKIILDILDNHGFYSELHKNFSKVNLTDLNESFTKKVSSKKNSDLVSDIDYPDGVYILHETLGVRTINEWNPEDNDGVVGVLVVEDDHKIVVALEDAPENLHWSKNYGLFNQSVKDIEDAESDFNGEQHCLKFNSLIFPAAYYCLHYKKGGREWYLPSSGELWMIYRYLDEIQTALSVVGGQKLITTWDEGTPLYWSSTENSATNTWLLYLYDGYLKGCGTKVVGGAKVRPVSNFSKNRNLKESFTRKISRKKNNELISKSDTAFVPDGVYILHETLGVKGVEGWNPKDNKGVVGILLIEDEHKIVVALEDSPNNLTWSSEYGLINQPVDFDELENAEPDFNGEYYCQRLDSPNYPAAYYCKTYNKGNRSWYLPSAGELRLIYNHLEEIQNALETVGGQKFVTTWDDGAPCYWSSTEDSATNAWALDTYNVYLDNWYNKVSDCAKVRPVSKFGPSTLKESFTRKISRKKNNELTTKADTAFVPDGVYILHETLGVKSVDGWNPEDNDGVVGVMVVEDDHKIVVALEDSPNKLRWSMEEKLVNRPVKDIDDAKSDFNGDECCKNFLNSFKFPAAYYCLNFYKKGGLDWYLPSTGELWMIYRHLEEVQTALSIVGGQKFVTKWKGGDVPWYWSSTEERDWFAWILNLDKGTLDDGYNKYFGEYNVRPVSKFKPSELRESFTKKIKNKSSKDLTDNQSFQLENGLYIFHETLGIQDAETWDSKYNKGVVGVLLIHNEHKFVASVDVSPKLYWSEKTGNFTSEQYRKRANALGDYDSEKNCSVLNSPEFPAAYYCLNYNKGGRKWRLGSLGEMSLLMTRYREDFDRILEKVGAVNLKGRGKTNSNWYWTSTEYSRGKAWTFYLDGGWSNAFGTIERYKTEDAFTVIPVSTFEYNNLEESFVGKVSRKRKNTLKESFAKKISSKKNTDLVPDMVYPDGVYILHETLGIKTVEGWNPKDNKGVVGVLVVEDDHKIVVATEDAPEDLRWSNEYGLINQPVDELEDAQNDFNGEYYCQKLDSPDFPAAYYCLNYKKGNRSWYLPSSGELWMINRHLDEIQNALLIIGGQKLITKWNEGEPMYWSSTEEDDAYTWGMYFTHGRLSDWGYKVDGGAKVRPVSNFTKNENLKESFTKKTTTKGRNEIIDQADNLVVDYDAAIKGLIKKYGFSTITKNVLPSGRGEGNEDTPYVRTHEPFTKDKKVTILGELELDKSESDDNDVTVIWRKTTKFLYRCPVEEIEKFSELPEEEKRDIYKYLLNYWSKRKN